MQLREAEKVSCTFSVNSETRTGPSGVCLPKCQGSGLLRRGVFSDIPLKTDWLNNKLRWHHRLHIVELIDGFLL